MITLAEGRQKSVLNHHPWLFSGAIGSHDSTAGDDVAGIEKVVDSSGAFLAWGYYDPDSHIPVRLMSWEEKDAPDEKWWAKMLKSSILRRRAFFSDGKDTTAFRLVHGDADFLGGLTVDVYGRVVRVVISSRLAYRFKAVTIKTIDALLKPSLIISNTDSAFCAIEKLSHEIEFYHDGGERFTPSERLSPIWIRESGLIYELVPGTGQKSGFFCDQRNTRLAIERFCRGAAVLDGFSYTGGFTLHALRAGALSVDAMDSSDDALHMLLANVNINEQEKLIGEGSRGKVTTTKCDLLERIRLIKPDHYDVIILDPPKLAATKGAAEKAMRAYKDLNRHAMERIKNTGVLVTCSCSGAVSMEDFRMIMGWAAKDAGAEAQILMSLGQPEDHPVRVSFPESEYLKVLIMRIIR